MRFLNPVSAKPRKKRKALFNAPLHALQKLAAAHLSKDLRVKLKKRSVQLKKGDKVRVMRGSFKKKEGKVTRVDLKRSAAFIEGIVRKKQSGKEVPVRIHASKLLVLELAPRTPKRKVKRDAERDAEREAKLNVETK
ncbi:MAG: 50S ribosomal protein L24 [Candidatus Norongarragalinales archaeon]